MSDQSQIPAKLDKVIDELHNTNRLLTQVVADNKHRDTRIAECEKHIDVLTEKVDGINEWKTVSSIAIENHSKDRDEYSKTWEKSKDFHESNTKISQILKTGAVVAILMIVVIAIGNGWITFNVGGVKANPSAVKVK